MSYPILDLKADLAGVIHGTQLNKITNLDGLINRAARKLLLDIDPQETIRISPFTNPIFDEVYNYAVPTDLKGKGVIDIRPQVNRRDIYSQQYNQYFDLIKNWQDMFTIQWNAAVKTMRISSTSLPVGITLNEAESITGNGTWAAVTSASGLAVDNQNYASGGGSLAFNLAAAGSTGALENSTMNSVDLTDHLNQGTLFVLVYLPTGSVFTNVKLRWGSSSANYYEQTATTQADGTAFQNGWNLLSFLWSTATTTGTPDYTAIDYIRVLWTYDGTAQTSVRLNNIVSRLGTILDIEYYSKYLFRNSSTGAFQETVLDDADLINLDTETYNLLFNLVAFFTSQQIQGVDAMAFDSNFFGQQYQEGVQQYKNKYKSQLQTPISTYYDTPKSGYGRFTDRFRR